MSVLHKIRATYTNPAVQLAPTASATIPALAPTWDIANAVPLVVNVGSPITSSTPGATYSISGAQSAGFAVDAATGQITVATDYVMLEAGVIGKWGTSRVFNFVASAAGHTPSTCVVTVTLDTSPYVFTDGVHADIPGADFIVGRTSTNPLNIYPGVALPSGWSDDGVVISATANNAQLIDYQITARRITCAGKTGCLIDQCIIDYLGGSDPGNGVLVGLSQGCTLSNSLLYCRGNVQGYFMQAVTCSINSLVDKIIVIASPNDVCNSNGDEFRYSYGRADSNAIYGTSGTPTVQPLQTTWGHSDCKQNYGVANLCWTHHNYFDVRAYPYDVTSTNIRTPAGTVAAYQPGGTVAVTNGSPNIVGTGTTWNTPGPGQLLVGEKIQILGDTTFRTILTVTDDTHIVLSTNVSRTTTSGLTYIPNVMIGSGTSWSTGSAANKLNVNDWLRVDPPGGGDPYLIVGVPSDTRVQVFCNILHTPTWSGQTIKTYPQADQRANTTSPLYQEGSLAGSINGTGVQLGERNILRGGGDVMETPDRHALSVGKQLALSTYRYNLLSDFQLSAFYGTNSTVLCGYENALLFGGAIAGQPINPIPATPTVTSTRQGLDYVQLAWTDQPSVIYEYRARTPAGSGTYGAWTLVSTLVNKVIMGLTGPSVSYEFEVRGKNALSEDGTTYLQVGTAGSLAQATGTATSYDADVATYIVACTGTPTIYRKDLWNDRVLAYKAAGIWSKYDFYLSMANFDADSVLHNLKSPGIYDAIINVSSTLRTDTGIRNLGANYTKFSGGYKGDFDAGNKFKQNDNSFGVWRRDNASGNGRAMGNAHNSIGTKQSAPNGAHKDSQSATTNVTGACSRSDGLWVVSRDNSGNYKFYGNNSGAAPNGFECTLLVTETETSVAAVDSEFIMGAENTATSTITAAQGLTATAEISMMFTGSNVTFADVQAINLIEYTYLHAIGAA